jgi:hypothetical protein
VLGLAIVGLALIVVGSFVGLYLITSGGGVNQYGWIVAAVGVGLVAVAVVRWVQARR